METNTQPAERSVQRSEIQPKCSEVTIARGRSHMLRTLFDYEHDLVHIPSGETCTIPCGTIYCIS